jgi:hypothetical protein
VEDNHVDRPGVEAQQCVKLTGTNSSIGLITLIYNAHQGIGGNRPAKRRAAIVELYSRIRVAPIFSVFCWLGGYCEEPEPDPIPNSAVKLLSADDTSS